MYKYLPGELLFSPWHLSSPLSHFWRTLNFPPPPSLSRSLATLSLEWGFENFGVPSAFSGVKRSLPERRIFKKYFNTSHLNLFLQWYTWRVMLIVRAKNKWICVATINGFHRIRCIILRGKIEAFMTNGRHGKIKTFIAWWNDWVWYHRLLLDRIIF